MVLLSAPAEGSGELFWLLGLALMLGHLRRMRGIVDLSELVDRDAGVDLRGPDVGMCG